jgi:hypothetical protein
MTEGPRLNSDLEDGSRFSARDQRETSKELQLLVRRQHALSGGG